MTTTTRAIPIDVERRVRAMTKADRRTWLRAHGWTQLGYSGSGSWVRPSQPAHFYTLAAAIRTALTEEQNQRAAS